MIRVGTFTGEIPKLVARYLPDGAAQVAYNCRLDDGALTPLRMGRLVARLETPAVTIYRHRETWLSWPVPVNVVPGPVAQDRLYITGNGPPQIRVDGNLWPLAIARPATAPTVSTEGEIDEDLYETVLYAYTFVTLLGEESEPSPLSDPIDWSLGMTNVLTGFDPAPPARVKRMRIYRSQSGQAGAANLHFIKERAYTTEPFIDNYGGNPIIEPIPSVSYNPPPDDLRGLIALPNGMMAGFVGKRLYFSEPWLPHAWPEKYVLTTDYPIVGLGAYGASLAVLTTGNPYVVTGTSPDNTVMEKLELNLPCVSARGIVDLGYAVAYPSHAGLVTISNQGAVLITKDTIGREQWQRLNPAGLVAGQFDGRYLASYAYAEPDGTQVRGIIIVDTAGQAAITRASDYADDMFYEIETGALYMLRNGTEIWEWDARGQPNGEMVWRSKPVVLPGHTNFAFLYVEADSGIDPEQAEKIRQRIEAVRAHNRAMMEDGSIGGEIGGAFLAGVTFAGDRLLEADEIGVGSGIGVGGGGAPVYDTAVAVTVYADGVEVATVYQTNEPVRLPAGFLARIWEFEVRGNMQVLGVTLGHAPSELAAAV